MGIEILLGAIMFLMIVGLAGFSVFFAFFLPGILRSVGYPVVVPGWGIRLQSLPPMNATVEDIARGLDLFVNRAVEIKRYNRKDLEKKINNMQVQWIRPKNKDGKRYIVDKWGRKIAGDHSGSLIRIVVLDDDTLDKTSFFHEIGHEAHELEDKVDYGHTDDQMWEEIVGWTRENFKTQR